MNALALREGGEGATGHPSQLTMLGQGGHDSIGLGQDGQDSTARGSGRMTSGIIRYLLGLWGQDSSGGGTTGPSSATHFARPLARIAAAL